jgi:hypothetical protein
LIIFLGVFRRGEAGSGLYLLFRLTSQKDIASVTHVIPVAKLQLIIFPKLKS